MFMTVKNVSLITPDNIVLEKKFVSNIDKIEWFFARLERATVDKNA